MVSGPSLPKLPKIERHEGVTDPITRGGFDGNGNTPSTASFCWSYIAEPCRNDEQTGDLRALADVLQLSARHQGCSCQDFHLSPNVQLGVYPNPGQQCLPLDRLSNLPSLGAAAIERLRARVLAGDARRRTRRRARVELKVFLRLRPRLDRVGFLAGVHRGAGSLC